MWGSATLVTLVSRTCMTVTSITQPVIAQRRYADSSTPGDSSIIRTAVTVVVPARSFP